MLLIKNAPEKKKSKLIVKLLPLVNRDAVICGFKLKIWSSRMVWKRKSLYFKNLDYNWTADESQGNSSLAYEGEFTHQRISRVTDGFDILVAESWLNDYYLSTAGILDFTLGPGSENVWRERLLTHNCFLAFNANLQNDPISQVAKDFDLEKLQEDKHMLPPHKLFMPTDMFKGQSMGRIFVELLNQSKDIGDLTDFDQFQTYAHDHANDFHLSPIEYFLKEVPKEFFYKVVEVGLLATTQDCYALDVNLQSPLYTEYLDCEMKEENELDAQNYTMFERLLDSIYESGLSADRKSVHLTAVLKLVGYRYQESHENSPRFFQSIVEFLAEPKDEEEDSDDEMATGINLTPPTLRQLMSHENLEGVSRVSHRSTSKF